MEKHRVKANEVASIQLIGDVDEKDVWLFDDIFDTCNTVVKAVDHLKSKGAKDVSIVGTHPVLSGKGIYNLTHKAQIKRALVSDTLHRNIGFSKVETVSCVPVLELVIKTLIAGGSVSEINL
jgi:ribose-phosphate pyrophosphokinase